MIGIRQRILLLRRKTTERGHFNMIRYNYLSTTDSHCMLLLHHGFTVLLTENPKVLIENSVSTLVFTKVLTVCGVLKMVDRLNTKNDYG